MTRATSAPSTREMKAASIFDFDEPLRAPFRAFFSNVATSYGGDDAHLAQPTDPALPPTCAHLLGTIAKFR